MNKFESFETGAFNELINCSFQDVREVFNLNPYFVLSSELEQFCQEAAQVKNWYLEELNKVEEYAQGEYEQKVNSGIDLFESDSPAFKIQTIEVQTKRKLIGLIRKYFNKELFQYNKPYIKDFDVFKEEAVETPHEMLVALNVNKNRIYSLLSILGFYQRHCGYFLSRFDFLKLCYDYSNQVYQMNKSLGMEYRFVNIFIGSCRIKPSRVKKVEDTDEEIDVEVEKYQSDKFIDIDKISLTMLIYPYLKNNTKEIHKIIEIMSRNFKKYKKDSSLGWSKTMEEVNTFIHECESKGIMKRL